MSDRELLERAAKAAGLKVRVYPGMAVEPRTDCVCVDERGLKWNPLTDDGDALRLAVKLGISIDMADQSAWTRIKSGSILIEEYWGGDYDPCYRRAIVRAAAGIGGNP